MTQGPLRVRHGRRHGEPVRVYIASTAACVDHACEAASQILAAGHEVVSTWHRENSIDRLDVGDAQRDDSGAALRRALRCLGELHQSNTLLWLIGDRMFSCGEDTWELGWAFARGRMIASVQVVRHAGGYPVFAALVPEYESVESWLKNEGWQKELKTNG